MLQIMVMILYFHEGDPASQIMRAFEKLGNKMEKNLIMQISYFS